MNRVSVAAERFRTYNQLGLFSWIRFRILLKPISHDKASLEMLVDFEKKLIQRSIPSRQIEKRILNCLSWYNREVKDSQIPDRLSITTLPRMLQVVFIFLEKSQSLNLAYRDLIITIVNMSDQFGRKQEAGSSISFQQFLAEYAWIINDLPRKWHEGQDGNLWGRWLEYRERGARHSLRALEIIASKVNNTELLSKVNRDIAPVIGLEETSLLMKVSKDFPEFNDFFTRITMQLGWWKLNYSELFPAFNSTSEIDLCLTFLESLTSDQRMSKCVQFANDRYPGFGLIPNEAVKNICKKREWIEIIKHDQLIDSVIEKFEQNIVFSYLSSVWYQYPGHGSHSIHWEFNKFTEYIPYDLIDTDWTKYNEKHRYYWNIEECLSQQYHLYIEKLQPRLCKLFRKLSQREIDVLFNVLPGHFRLEQYTKTVDVPVEWKEDVIWEEGYEKWVGFYDKQVKIARPQRFIKHIFTFERPNLQEAINTLDHILN